MDTVIVPNSGELAVLQELVATGNLLDGVKLKLFQNSFTPTAANVLADFTEASFSGYAAATGTWKVPGYRADGSAVVALNSVQFAAASPLTVTQIVYGWYITDTAGAVLHCSAKFATPVSISRALQILEVLASYPLAAA